MIVVGTGPSASGKTTWCRRHAPAGMIPEYTPSGAEPDGADIPAQAGFWTAVSCRRWQAELDRERASGLAVCDDDPLKPHYSWPLARIGATGPDGVPSPPPLAPRPDRGDPAVPDGLVEALPRLD
jgi:hypothetical protein